MNKLWRGLIAVAMCVLIIAALLVAMLAVIDAVDHSAWHLLRILICVPLLAAAWALYKWVDSME
ncbi:MAG: hypothetical protein ACI4PC_08210 [Oscillospiraceae bacterium]